MQHPIEFRPIAESDLVEGRKALIRDEEGCKHAALWSGRAWVYGHNPSVEIVGFPIEIAK